MTKKPNIIFISIDALRHDRLSIGGYERATSPTLERLAPRSTICRNHFALNASTMGAFPTIMNSSRPLSYGGFDDGVFNRPPSVFEALKAGGYQTYLMSTVHWVNRFYGYGRGIDVEEMLFSLGSMIGTTGALTRTSIERFNAGELSKEQFLQLVQPVVEASFDRLDEFAHERIARYDADKRDFSNAPFFSDRYEYRRILGVLKTHRAAFAANPEEYLSTYMPAPFNATGWLTPVWRKFREPGRLVEELSVAIQGRILETFNPSAAFLKKQRYKRYPDAEAMVSHMLSTIDARDDARPFVMWTHLFDTHLPYCAGSHPNWYRNTRNHLSALGYDPAIDPGLTFGKGPGDGARWEDWGALYDAAVHFIDGAVDKLVQGLERLGISDDTMVVLCGDHGEELGENGDISHHFRLYEYNTHVPLVMFGAGIDGAEIDHFTTHLDIAPTITSVAGAAPEGNWEGESVYADAVARRDHVLMETFYGSPCDFEHRPIYMAVRDKSFHLMWKEYRDPTDKLSPDGQQLYDAVEDPLQQHNIFDPQHPAVIRGKRIMAERLKEIPEVSDSRIEKILGSGSAVPVSETS